MLYRVLPVLVVLQNLLLSPTLGAAASAAAIAHATASAITPCPPDKLVAYKVILHTFWTRDRFPKHYPEWRPAAQWSRLIGRSHVPEYTLFRLGSRVSEPVKAFAEAARGNALADAAGQGGGGILDDFSAPAISTGAGRTEATFHADSNHSLVSLMTKMVPSPDWFVGLDSFQLCVEGGWLDSITVEADPLDAGTDNGFTFTAPNWPTDPQGIVYRMASRYPSHPAGSFYYPHLKRLPPIATFQFIKLREYELTERFRHAEDERRYELLQLEHIDSNAISVLNNNDDIARQIEQERQETPLQQQQMHEQPGQSLAHKSPSMQLASTATQSPSDVVARGDKGAILNSIVESYTAPRRLPVDLPGYPKRGGLIGRPGGIRGGKLKGSKLRKTVQRKTRPPRDCRVTEWSSWSPCSKSCGIGEMQRHRQVKKHARRGGHPCPPLTETKWCGSARACNNIPYTW